MKRIGQAKSYPLQDGRRYVYGVFEMTEAYGHPLDPPARYARYEGHDRADGTMVGLPLRGAPASHNQPYHRWDEIKGTFQTVNIFKRDDR